MHSATRRTATVAAFFAAICITTATEAATTTFHVEVPASTPPDDTVYIAGDFQGWDPGHPAYALTEQPDGTWEITITLPDGVPIEFKFTRGSWAVVEKGPNGEEIANRTHTPQGTETLNLIVATWADGLPSTITGHVESFTFAPFLGGRRCWVYLPPDYETSADHYPVLYMHDGQNIFDEATSFAGEWQVDEACETLIGNCTIEPIIVVGIENAGSGRCFEYTPFADPVLPCSGGGIPYLLAVRDILIPEVNQRYRTLTGPGHTYMSGSSLGGIISNYAGYAHADTWGRIAAVSPAFWTQSELFTFVAQQGRPPTLTHYYQDMGTAEGGDNIDDLRAMRDILLAQGFVEGEDLLSIEAVGHGHNEFYWAQRFPDILRFLTDPPAPSGDWNCDGDVNFIDFVESTYCLTGPGTSSSDPSCRTFDFDEDNDIDLEDIATLLQLYSP